VYPHLGFVQFLLLTKEEYPKIADVSSVILGEVVVKTCKIGSKVLYRPLTTPSISRLRQGNCHRIGGLTLLKKRRGNLDTKLVDTQ
jgi:hypothetical protein